MLVSRQSYATKGCRLPWTRKPWIASLRFWAARMGESGNGGWRRCSNSSKSWSFAGSLVTAGNFDRVVGYRGSVLAVPRTSWPGCGSAGIEPRRPAW
jgi:hypothetical protein